MIEIIAVVIIILWIVGYVGAHSIIWLVEALGVLAVISILLRIIRGK